MEMWITKTGTRMEVIWKYNMIYQETDKFMKRFLAINL